MTYPTHGTRRLHPCFRALLALFFCGSLLAAESAKPSFDIPAGPASQALKQFSAQSGEQLLFSTNDLEGVRTNAVQGELSAKDALARLLQDTGLVARQDEKTGAFSVRRERLDDGKNGSSRPVADRAAESRLSREEVLKLDAFEVMGTKLLNMDIPRSRDDAQPYVVFKRDAIEQSGATNIEDFLRIRLTSNAQAFSNSQLILTQGTTSTVNLRGLGSNQTLILVDGHRLSTGMQVNGGTPRQADLNGIPLAAVERIEVLPTTASGIYGGSATGGVVNVVLRRDYSGAELKLTYDNSFDTDTARRQVDFAARFNLEGGKTNILLAGSYSDANSLAIQDRVDIWQHGYNRILENNPALIYGSLNVWLGSTTNIRSSTGVNLTLKPQYGGTPLNSPVTFVPVGYAGPSSDNGAGLVANAGKYNFTPPQTTQNRGGARRGLMNGPTVESGSVTIRRQFSDSFQAFLEAGASNNTGRIPSSNVAGIYVIQPTAANNPFQQALRVAVPVETGQPETITRAFDRRILAGVVMKLPAEWRAEADYTWDRNRSFASSAMQTIGTDAVQVGNGTIDVFRDFGAPIDISAFTPTFVWEPRYVTLKDAAVRFAGPVWQMPGGPLSLAALGEHRNEDLSGGIQRNGTALSVTYPPQAQKVDSAYLEMKVPLVSRDNRIPGIESLELQLAGRHDKYVTDANTLTISATSTASPTSVRSTTTSDDPTIALRYEPVRDVILRGSYGTGFLPPALNQLVEAIPTSVSGSLLNWTDPKRGNTALSGTVLVDFGGSRTLKPELSETWSAGVVFTPRAIPGLRLSLDWSKIEKRDVVVALSASQATLLREDDLPGLVTRGPVPPGDPYGVGLITGLNVQARNASQGYIEAYDVAADYDLDGGDAGRFSFFFSGTWQTHYKIQFLPGDPFVENIGVSSELFLNISPLKIKANAGARWTRGRTTLGWTARYVDKYKTSSTPSVIQSQGGDGTVPSEIFHDVFASYRFNGASGRVAFLDRLLTGTEVQVGIRNVFNHLPPVDTASNSSYMYSIYGDPRGVSYYISAKHNF